MVDLTVVYPYSVDVHHTVLEALRAGKQVQLVHRYLSTPAPPVWCCLGLQDKPEETGYRGHLAVLLACFFGSRPPLAGGVTPKTGELVTVACVDGELRFYGGGALAVSEMLADAERFLRQGELIYAYCGPCKRQVAGFTKDYYLTHLQAFAHLEERFGRTGVAVIPAYPGETYASATLRREEAWE